MTYPVIDVSQWNEDVEAAGYVGEREKIWLVDPVTQKLAMMKFPRDDRGEHWAEKLCSVFAEVLGFPCAKVDLAVRNGRMGCLSYFFVNKEEGYSHYDGGQYFPFDYDRYSNRGYNFQMIESVLSELGLFKEFLYILVFDALVGNGDRHQDNWGITRQEKTNSLSISPLYDNSACLGRDISTEKAVQMLQNTEEMLRFIYRGKSKIGWFEKRQEKHFELVKYALMLYPKETYSLIQSLKKLTDELIKDIVGKLPESVISTGQKEFVILYVSTRRDILLRIGDTMKNQVNELMLVWKDPQTRQRFIVGELAYNGKEYSFRYVNPELEDAVRHGFQNYPAFPDVKVNYVQENLFHSIKERLPRPKRPDYLTILNRYGLDANSTEMEILAATHGRTPTDTFEFVREVKFNVGEPFALYFKLAGGRHYDLQNMKGEISIGNNLLLVREVDNVFDLNAVQVLTQTETLIGYVPKYYSKAISEMLASAPSSYEAVIVGIDMEHESPDEWVTIKATVVEKKSDLK